MFSRKSKEEAQKAKDEKKQKSLQKRQEKLDHKKKVNAQRYDFKSFLSKLKFETYTKRLVGVITIVGLIDLQLSYVLAFMDKIDIAESLSSQICTTILGTALIYMIRAYFDTKAEKNNEKETINQDAEDHIMDQVRSIFIQAGIDIPSNVDSFTDVFHKDDSTDINDTIINPTVPVPDDTVEEEPTLANADEETEDNGAVG